MKKKGYNITLGIFIGLIAGVIVGIIMPEWANTALSVVASIYMSALKMMIFPLVFTSLVMGIIGIGDIAKTGKVGLHALLWYTGTTALASGLGLVLPRMLHLGKNAHIVATKTQVEAATFNGLLDTLQNIIPSNPVEAFATGNMLQVLALAVIIGLACLAIQEKTPFGVFACIATVMYSNGVDTMLQLGQVLLALYITFYLYAFIIYGGMVKFFGKYNPIQFFKDIAPAGLNAFGTCSSSATIPISLKCASEKIGIPEEITSLTLPLGATINMDAVSILMSFMITFFATALGIDLSIGTMVTVLACNVLLSIGTPGVPGGAIAAFAALCPIAGIPTNQILGVYISVNTLCDMGATCVNVIGDLACSTVLKQTLHFDKKK